MHGGCHLVALRAQSTGFGPSRRGTEPCSSTHCCDLGQAGHLIPGRASSLICKEVGGGAPKAPQTHSKHSTWLLTEGQTHALRPWLSQWWVHASPTLFVMKMNTVFAKLLQEAFAQLEGQKESSIYGLGHGRPSSCPGPPPFKADADTGKPSVFTSGRVWEGPEKNHFFHEWRADVWSFRPNTGKYWFVVENKVIWR